MNSASITRGLTGSQSRSKVRASARAICFCASEALESRSLLTAFAWDGGGDHVRWSDPRNWQNDRLPGAADDVVIAAGFTPTYDAPSPAIKSLTCASPLLVNAPGTTLTLNDASIITGELRLHDGGINGAGDLDLKGGLYWSGGAFDGAGILRTAAGTYNHVSLNEDLPGGSNHPTVVTLGRRTEVSGTLDVDEFDFRFAGSTPNLIIKSDGSLTGYWHFQRNTASAARVENYGTINASLDFGPGVYLANEGTLIGNYLKVYSGYSSGTLTAATSNGISVNGDFEIRSGDVNLGQVSVGGKLTLRAAAHLVSTQIPNLYVLGGTAQIDQDLGIYGTLAVDHGELTGSGNVTAIEGFFASGHVSGTGSLKISGDTYIYGETLLSRPLTIGRTSTNNLAPGVFALGEMVGGQARPGSVSIDPGTASDQGRVSYFDGAGIFVKQNVLLPGNAITFGVNARVLVRNGVTSFSDVPLINAGSLSISADGTLKTRFADGATGLSTASLDNKGTLETLAPISELGGSITFDGAGTFSGFDPRAASRISGKVTIATPYTFTPATGQLDVSGTLTLTNKVLAVSGDLVLEPAARVVIGSAIAARIDVTGTATLGGSMTVNSVALPTDPLVPVVLIKTATPYTGAFQTPLVASSITTPAGLANFYASYLDPRSVNLAVGPYAAKTAALTPETDTGISNIDRLTRLARPTLTGKAEPGKSVTISFGNAEAGTAIVASDGTWTITPTRDLADGSNIITIVVSDSATGYVSPIGTLGVNVDRIAPSIIGGTDPWLTQQQSTFSVSETLAGLNNFTAKNLTTGLTLTAADFNLFVNGRLQLSVSPKPNSATTTNGNANTPLSDGNWRFTFPTTITDAAGNGLAAEKTFDFFLLAGDFNHDRTINFDDLVILSQNYGRKAGVGPRLGDANYDNVVNFDDLVILAQKYTRVLAAPAVLALGTPVTAPLSDKVVATNKAAGPARRPAIDEIVV